jgi:hypothetical protein
VFVPRLAMGPQSRAQLYKVGVEAAVGCPESNCALN